MNEDHPVRFSVEYPDRPLDRLTTALRIFTVIPIAIVLGSIMGFQGTYEAGAESGTWAVGGAGTSRGTGASGAAGGTAAPRRLRPRSRCRHRPRSCPGSP